MLSIAEYETKAAELLDSGDYDKIFLATDSEEALERFKSRFEGKLKFFDDSSRSDTDVSVAFSKSERKDHHYLLGLEVLKDMSALAGCGALVAGLSQVSLAARITNVASRVNYKDVEIISAGVAYNGTDSRDYYDKFGNAGWSKT